MYDNFTHLPNVTPEQAAYQARVEYFSKRAPIGGEWVISNLYGKVICRTSQPFRVAEYNPDMVKVESSHLYEKRIARMGLTEVWDDGEFSGYASSDISTLLPETKAPELSKVEAIELELTEAQKELAEVSVAQNALNKLKDERDNTLLAIRDLEIKLQSINGQNSESSNAVYLKRWDVMGAENRVEILKEKLEAQRLPSVIFNDDSDKWGDWKVRKVTKHHVSLVNADSLEAKWYSRVSPNATGYLNISIKKSVEAFVQWQRQQSIAEFQLSYTYATMSPIQQKVFEMCYLNGMGTESRYVPKLLGIQDITFDTAIKFIEKNLKNY